MDSIKKSRTKQKKGVKNPDNTAPDTGAASDPEHSQEDHTRIFPIVGIGASAGGLEAFTDLLKHLPTDTGMAFILIQHLHPDYPSALSEILSRVTSMNVSEVTDGIRVEPNQVYVIPPNTYMGIMHGTLQLMPRSDISGQNLPIDYFFLNLAEDMGRLAIGVILSGTASDGVLGLKAIKVAGGITLVQDKASAKYDGMPHSAIAAGCVDMILPPDKIAMELTRIAGHPYVIPKSQTVASEELSTDVGLLNKLFLLLRNQTGHDFTYYKPSTIQRRTKRRMLLHKLERLKDYIRYLQENPSEVVSLFHDILINVTGFFRDPQAFEALTDKVFPILKDSTGNGPIRIWVPGCSSGEEAYSLAIALLEYRDRSAANFSIQIFATDIDDVAIEGARAGLYPETISQDVSDERLRQFFTRVDGGGYQIKKSVRDMCVFALQNVAQDPPFSRIDLISCRNLLIYMGPVLQKKIMNIFHYSLKPGGYLFLGSAESIGDFSDLYRVVDSKERVYTKKAVARPRYIELNTTSDYQSSRVPKPITSVPSKLDHFDLSREVNNLLMKQFTPAGVVVDENLDIQQFHGQTAPYLESPPGHASLNLLKMSRQDLLLPLNTLLKKVLASHDSAKKSGVRIVREDKNRLINIQVLPIMAQQKGALYLLVVFEDVTSSLEPVARASDGAASKGLETDTQTLVLKQELVATKEYLQSVIEQQETGNEELRSANEEIQSSNEELQSINEELETAKEELQSTNEELATVNHQLEVRNLNLNQANSDLSNLVSSINIAVVILEMNMGVRYFSPRAKKLLNLINSDIGRPFSDIKPNINIPGLKKIITEVLENLQPLDMDLQDSGGCWYSVRIQAYKTLDNKIDGVVIVYIEIDEMKKSLDAATHAQNYAEAIISAVRHPMLILDDKLAVVSASHSFFHAFKVTGEETIGNLLYRLGNGQWGIPELRTKLKQVIQAGAQFDGYTISHDFEQIGHRIVSISGRSIPGNHASGRLVLMQIEDITEQKLGTAI